MTTVEKLAQAMCRIEVRMRRFATLDEMLLEVDRTWRRHIPEAERLVLELADKGITSGQIGVCRVIDHQGLVGAERTPDAEFLDAEICRANAKLIAAAPILYNFVQSLAKESRDAKAIIDAIGL